jgi:hypothetical protein
MRLKGATYLIILWASLLSLGACKSYAVDNEPPPADSAYFSVKQFIRDQILIYSGQPYTLFRVRHQDGAIDTTLVNFFNMDWPSILNTFNATDISPRKYLGKYTFSVYDEDITGNRGYTYTSTDPKNFTRTLIINTDPTNNKITSLYIETAKSGLFSNKTQKLLYIPLQIIQIQETEGRLLGKARNLRIDYRFMRPDEEAEEQL